MIAPPLLVIDEALPMLMRPSPDCDAVFCVEADLDQRTTSPPLVVIGSLEPTITLVVALNNTSPVVVVVIEVAPPMLTAPAVAVTEIPFAPDAAILAVVVTAVPVMAMLPFADRAAPTETAPVAGIDIVPLFVVVIALETVTAAPLIVTGPATEVVPPEMVTPEVLPDFPIRKLVSGPDKLKLVVPKVELKFAPEDSNTTAPVVFTETVGVPFSASPMTFMSPFDAVAPLSAPRLIVPVQYTPLAPPLMVIGPPLARMSELPPK
jgi:hypothetical protein